MISRTYSSSWVVFKAALKRLKWLGILYGVALFLQLPLLLWMEFSKQKALQGSLWAEVANKSFLPQMLFHPVAHLTNIAAAVIFGLILFYYLQSDRASTFFHNLPIKRWSLYCQNLLAGLTLIWLPILINGLLIYGVLTVFGVTQAEMFNPNQYGIPMDQVNANLPITVAVGKLLGYWLFLSLLMTGLFFIFTVFVGMLTGNVLLQGALTFIGLFLPLGLYLLIKFNMERLLYGYARSFNDRNIEWLSPPVSYLNEQNFRFLFGSWKYYIWYLAVALLLCGISIYLYKKRHAEAAGETLAAGWIRWIFKYGVAACAALTGGLYFSTFNENSAGVLYLGYFIGAALGYAIADMIAYKSFHFYKRWKGMLVFGAVFFLLLSTVKLDFYGYTGYVPNQDEVKEVTLSNLSRDGFTGVAVLSGKDNVNRVREFHRQVIKLEQENRKATQRRMNPGSRVMFVDLTYVLNSGRKVKRTYGIDVDRYRESLLPVISSPEAKKSMYSRLFKMDEGKIDQINITNHRLGKNIRIYKRAEIEEALAALRKDVLDVSYEAVVEGKVPNIAVVEFMSKTEVDKKYGFYNLSYYEEFKNFSDFLAKGGYLEELLLKTEDVLALTIKKVGTAETVEIKDKEKIKTLLKWSSVEDEGAYLMRQQQPRNRDFDEYYGKGVKKDGRPLYVSFEISPYVQQLIQEILTDKK